MSFLSEFRAWDHVKKEMIYGAGVVGNLNHAIKLKSYDGKTKICECEAFTDCFLENTMICLGIFDNNGIKIFENDIISNGKKKGVVMFGFYNLKNVNHFGFYIKDLSTGEPYNLPLVKEVFDVVIGNTFEGIQE